MYARAAACRPPPASSAWRLGGLARSLAGTRQWSAVPARLWSAPGLAVLPVPARSSADRCARSRSLGAEGVAQNVTPPRILRDRHRTVAWYHHPFGTAPLSPSICAETPPTSWPRNRLVIAPSRSGRISALHACSKVAWSTRCTCWIASDSEIHCGMYPAAIGPRFRLTLPQGGGHDRSPVRCRACRAAVPYPPRSDATAWHAEAPLPLRACARPSARPCGPLQRRPRRAVRHRPSARIGT